MPEGIRQASARCFAEGIIRVLKSTPDAKFMVERCLTDSRVRNTLQVRDKGQSNDALDGGEEI
jgi:hypothetical protein